MDGTNEKRFRAWQVGGVPVTRIVEGDAHLLPCAAVLAEGSPELVRQHDWVIPRYATPEGDLVLPFHAFVAVSAGKRILVNTCIGNDKKREVPPCNNLQNPFLEDMAAAGFPPESIDYVVCTHFHFDHVGWNTRKVGDRWVPTFPNARYLFPRAEWEHCQNVLRDKTAEVEHIIDSILPVLEAGLADFVTTDHRITDEVRLEPSPGHTPGHVCVHIASQGQQAVVTGDVFHNPLQFAVPEMRTTFCHDHDQSRRTRLDFLARYGERKALVIGSHFADPTAGWIVKAERNWRFDID